MNKICQLINFFIQSTCQTPFAYIFVYWEKLILKVNKRIKKNNFGLLQYCLKGKKKQFLIQKYYSSNEKDTVISELS